MIEIHIRIYFYNYFELDKLNHERKKLNEASQIIIYVEDQMLVTTKIILGQIRLDLIEMRRISAYKSETFYASFLG